MCANGQACDGAGQCVMCTPDCTNKMCGDNGCGGSCGTCTGQLTCNGAGQCVGCTPDCTNKMCGDNGCGGSCGTCMGSQTCSGIGMCVEFMPGGITHKNTVARPGNPPRPAVGVRYTEPTFGTTLRRVSDRSEQLVDGDPGDQWQGGYEVQLYSQLQAFSPDGQYILLGWDDISFFNIRRVSDFSMLPVDLSRANVPRWHATLPHTIIHWDPNNDTDLMLEMTDVETGVKTTIADMVGYETVCNGESFEEMSHDGKWIVAMARRDGTSRNFNCRDWPELTDIIAYNVDEGRYGARINIEDLNMRGPCRENDRPDWVGPSPLGNYIVASWVADGVDRCNGVEVYDIETGAFVGRLTDHRQHGDLGVVPNWQSAPANRREYYVTFETNLGPNNLDYPTVVGVSWLPGTLTNRAPSTPLVELASGVGSHISCQGPPGRCLVSASTTDGPTAWNPFQTEIFMVDLMGNVNRLAHHHSSECAYWAQPRATFSKDGRHAIFSSDWGVDSCNVPGNYPDWLRIGRSDPYVIELSP